MKTYWCAGVYADEDGVRRWHDTWIVGRWYWIVPLVIIQYIESWTSYWTTLIMQHTKSEIIRGVEVSEHSRVEELVDSSGSDPEVL